jgi:hypothetical protein
MAQEQNPVKEETTVVPEADKLISDIADVKKNMVPREEYERLSQDNAKLRHALLTGVTEKVVEPLKSAAELKKEYAEAIKAGVTNVKGFETALKLREAVINETGKDPFMTEALMRIDPDFGERVAGALADMVDKSDGNPQMFNAFMSQNLRGA